MPYYSQLFPPVLPPNLPAHDGTQSLRVSFQVSVANTRDQFKHAQVIVHRLDSNANALNTSTYPLGIIFISNSNILYDSTSGMYYFDLPANLLPLNSVYKLQIRVGAQDLATVNPLNYIWLNTPSVYELFSEWSTVCLIKPITVPTFDLTGFTSKDGSGNYVQPVYLTDNVVNVANTPGFLFIGKYQAQDTNREETLSSYQMILYAGNGTTVESSWEVLSDSGVKHIGQYEAQNMQHSFDYVLEKGETYYAKFIVTSKNGYTNSKIYKFLVMYSDIDLYNTFHIYPNEDSSRLTLEVIGKQLLFRPVGPTVTEPMFDGTGLPPDIIQTHMIIAGTVKEAAYLDFNAIDGKWVLQLRALGIKPRPSRASALKNPVVTLTEKSSVTAVTHVIKLCAMNYKISFDREVVPRYMSAFILVKECWFQGKMILRQEKMVQMGTSKNGTITESSKMIGPMNEYYFYIKEDNGFMDFQAEYLRGSSNTELMNFVNAYKFN